MSDQKIVVRVGMASFGKRYADQMQTMQLDLEELHKLQEVMMKAMAEWKEWNKRRAGIK